MFGSPVLFVPDPVVDGPTQEGMRWQAASPVGLWASEAAMAQVPVFPPHTSASRLRSEEASALNKRHLHPHWNCTQEGRSPRRGLLSGPAGILPSPTDAGQSTSKAKGVACASRAHLSANSPSSSGKEPVPPCEGTLPKASATTQPHPLALHPDSAPSSWVLQPSLATPPSGGSPVCLLRSR